MPEENGFRNKLNTVCSRQGWNWKKGDCVSQGPQNSTMWKCDVYVNGTPYEGEGSSKGAAWEQAAKSALADLKAKHPEAVPDELYMP